MYTPEHKALVAQALQAFKAHGVPAAMPYLQQLVESKMDKPIELTEEGLQALLDTEEGDAEDTTLVAPGVAPCTPEPPLALDRMWAQLEQEPNEVWQELVALKQVLFETLSPCQIAARKMELIRQYRAWKEHTQVAIE